MNIIYLIKNLTGAWSFLPFGGVILLGSLERICGFQFMYIIWFLVVYFMYFKKPVKETTFSSKIHKAFFANIRNDCVFSVIKNKQHSYAIRVWALSS